MCAPCRFVAAFLLNLAIVLDVAVNALLLGRPPETLSQRFARLRQDGGPRYAWIGRAVCGVLTWIGRQAGSARDHCTWALDTNAGHDGAELWRWSK